MGAIQNLRRAVDRYNNTALILRIAVGIVVGILLAFTVPGAGWIGMLGDLFVGALRAIAPLLVFMLVISALSQGGAGFDRRFSMVIFFYLLTTFLAAFLAVIVSFLFPVTLVLAAEAEGAAAPSGIAEVLGNLLMTMIANPLASIIDGRYLGILFWAVVFGIALGHDKNHVRQSGGLRLSGGALDYQSGPVRHYGTGVLLCLLLWH